MFSLIGKKSIDHNADSQRIVGYRYQLWNVGLLKIFLHPLSVVQKNI